MVDLTAGDLTDSPVRVESLCVRHMVILMSLELINNRPQARIQHAMEKKFTGPSGWTSYYFDTEYEV